MLRFTLSLCAAIAMVAAAVVTTDGQVQPGLVQDAPVEVRLGNGGVGKVPKKYGARTSGTTTSTGGLAIDIQNKTGRAARDLLIKVHRPPGGKIKNISFPDGQFQNTQTLPSESAYAVVPGGGDSVEDGDKVAIDLQIEDKNGNNWSGPVTLEITLSRPQLEGDDIWLSATDDIYIGDGDPIASIASLGISGFDTSPVQVVAGNSSADLNMLVLAECHGFRFRSGSMVISVSGNPKFDITGDTVIEAWDESGDQVTSQTRVSFSGLRIDADGNFVFDMTRKQDDDKHIAIVIRGLGITNLSETVGASFAVTFSGAPIRGDCLDNLYEIVSIVE